MNSEPHDFLATEYCMSLKFLGKSKPSRVWCHNFKGDFILRRFPGLNISASKMPDSPAKKAKVEEEPHPADLVQVSKQYKLESIYHIRLIIFFMSTFDIFGKYVFCLFYYFHCVSFRPTGCRLTQRASFLTSSSLTRSE